MDLPEFARLLFQQNQPPQDATFIHILLGHQGQPQLNKFLSELGQFGDTHKPHQSDGTVHNCFWRAHLKRAKVRYHGPNTARHTFISQLLTAGIAKEWTIRQVGHTSTRMIDEHYGKWISADATGMAQFVSERMGVSERLVPKWPHGRRKEELIQ